MVQSSPQTFKVKFMQCTIWGDMSFFCSDRGQQHWLRGHHQYCVIHIHCDCYGWFFRSVQRGNLVSCHLHTFKVRITHHCVWCDAWFFFCNDRGQQHWLRGNHHYCVVHIHCHCNGRWFEALPPEVSEPRNCIGAWCLRTLLVNRRRDHNYVTSHLACFSVQQKLSIEVHTTCHASHRLFVARFSCIKHTA